ncbi:MAG TPA: hydrogenase formation protein HypD [Planctomycetota bacterium]|nr:hydrogenase formation protein HypD [Planctomycetota bacterium]
MSSPPQSRVTRHASRGSVPDLLHLIAERAARLGGRPVRFMEVCGTHTMAMFRSGIRAMLPPNVKLLSGPGCPVCVTPMGMVDAALAIARRPGVCLATFGDMVRVPGSASSLERAKAEGADVRMVYSPLDALKLAEAEPRRTVVFFAIGFETTTPAVAATVAYARDRGLANMLFLVANKVIPPAMEAILAGGEVKLDGFLCPGHVSVITGSAIYEPLAANYRVPCVVTGFEAEDILEGIAMLLLQVVEADPKVEIQYKRWVHPEGNAKARERVDEVFRPCDAAWRGLGTIPMSGLELRPELRAHDALEALGIEVPPELENPGCSCGEVLRGLIEPPECPLFAGRCTPATPVGPCMVSTEGSCAAYYKYGER